MVLIGYWPLNETSGSTAYDYSGRENHGTVKNGGDSTVVGNGTGPTGQSSYSFDGNDDLIDTSSYDPAPSGGFSVSAWVNPQSTGNYIFSQGPDTDNNLALKVNSSNISGWIQISGTNDTITGSSIPTGEWAHIVFTYSSANEKRLYINGVTDAKASTSNDPSQIGSSPLKVSSWIGGGNNLAMYLSELRTYNHILTPQEVQYLYTVGKQGKLTTNKKHS